MHFETNETTDTESNISAVLLLFNSVTEHRAHVRINGNALHKIFTSAGICINAFAKMWYRLEGGSLIFLSFLFRRRIYKKNQKSNG